MIEFEFPFSGIMFFYCIFVVLLIKLIRERKRGTLLPLRGFIGYCIISISLIVSAFSLRSYYKMNLIENELESDRVVSFEGDVIKIKKINSGNIVYIEDKKFYFQGGGEYCVTRKKWMKVGDFVSIRYVFLDGVLFVSGRCIISMDIESRFEKSSPKIQPDF